MEQTLLQRFCDALAAIRPALVAQANRMTLANVAFWPTGKCKTAKKPRRMAKHLALVKRLRKQREQQA